MKLAAAAPGILHALQQNWVSKKISFLDHHVEFSNVHVDDSPSADVQMPDFAVSHLPGGQTDIAPAGVDERVRKFLEQTVIVGLARQRDCICVGRRSIAPAIENDKNQWSIFHKSTILNEASAQRTRL